MDSGGGSIIQSPITMAHEQLPSPLAYDGSYSMPGALEIGPGSAPQRRASKGASAHPGGIVKRSASTPNVRSMSSGSDPTLTLSEKRRNKLGYHRTSVACVHCRRRKIRCLLAPDDPGNRCANCIRLKKECNFYPVDQQPPNERRPRTGSKVDAKGSSGGGGSGGGGSVSSSSSPNVAGSRAGDGGDTYPQFGHLPHGTAGSYPGAMMMGSSGMSPPGSAANTRFEVGDQQHSGWDLRFFESQQIPTGHSAADEHSGGGPGFWKVPETPLTPYSPYSSARGPAVVGAPGGFAYPPAPLRTMSYGHIEDAAHGRHDSHGAPFGPVVADLRRSTIDMPPPNAPTMQVGGPEGMAYSTMPAAWGMLPTQSPKQADFGGWYGDPGQLAKVQEDEVSHFGDIHGGMYAGGVQR